MAGDIQPLANNFAIVDAAGKPTEYFIRWAQERSIDISNGISIEQVQELIDAFAAERQIIAGSGLTGGGPLSDDVTLAWAGAALGDLSDVDLVTVPPTDGQVIVFDEASGTWIPADQSGGGGGGGGGGPAKGRYWRLRGISPIVGAGGPGMGLSAVRYLDAGGVNLVGTGTASASQTGAAPWTAAGAYTFPWADSVGWYSDGVLQIMWSAYDFGVEVTPKQVSFSSLQQGGGQFPWTVGKIIALDYSSDGLTWKTAQLINPIQAVPGTLQTYDIASVPSGGGGGGAPWYYKPPKAADFPLPFGTIPFTQFVDDPDVGLIAEVPAAHTGAVANCFTIPNPASPWSCVMRANISVRGAGYANFNIVAGNGVSRFACYGWDSRNCVHYMQYSTAGYDGAEQLLGWTGQNPPWYKWDYDPTTGVFKGYTSPDGKGWTLMVITGDTRGYLGGNPAVIGIAMMTEAHGYNATMSVDHWTFTNA